MQLFVRMCQNVTNKPHQYPMNATSCTLVPCHVRTSQQHKHTYNRYIQRGHPDSPLHRTDKTKSVRSCSFSHAPSASPQGQMLAAVYARPSQFPSYAWHPPTQWQAIRFSLLHRACCFDYFSNIPNHALIIYTLISTKFTLKHLKSRFHPARYSRYIHKRTVMLYDRILHKSITSVYQPISTC
jgi:hypothetical protein